MLMVLRQTILFSVLFIMSSALFANEALKFQTRAQKHYESGHFKKYSETLESYSAEITETGLYQLAISYHKIKDYEGALRHFATLVNRHPNKYLYYYKQGLSYMQYAKSLPNPKLGKNPRKQTQDLAIQSFRQSIKLRPHFMPAYKALVKIFRADNNGYELREVYRSMERKFGLKFEIAAQLCELSSNQGFIDAALRYCKQSIKLKKDYADSYAYLALSLQDKSERDEARKILFKASRKFPKSFIIQETLGLSLHVEKNHSSAIKYLKRAIDIYPKSTRTHLALAQSLFEKQSYEKALPAFLKSCQIDNRNVTPLKVATSKLKNKRKRDIASVYKKSIDKCYLKFE